MEVKQCFLCGRNGSGDRLERHHIFSNANRKNSEKYGLVVYLCGERCHRTGRYAAHNNLETMGYLQRKGQEMAEKQMSREEFIRIFGKNYL